MPFIQLHRKRSNNLQYSELYKCRDRVEEQVCQRVFPFTKVVPVCTCWGTEVILLRSGKGEWKSGLSSACTLRWHSEACLTRKHLTAARGKRKLGGFTEPQVCDVVKAGFSLCCSSRSLSSVPVHVLLVQAPSRFKTHRRVHGLSKSLRPCPAGKQLWLGAGGHAGSYLTPVIMQ